ncbi:hypothetical protein [Acetobacter lovaniensis]|uniref:Tail fiber protein n=1 Tax=Acetobacter lovaniensis TaxID=104100 RepID=A0A841QK85_9PROT|nr:hypothetical protein [Acetobacter lovaniensis]MBB6458705.1 hypothetical protein [Acetobacter lovaniensis]NHN82910.1 hypothetical protein [Acetobacter lovaniensis]GBQ66540.1 hypothetical protein AA0474_1148 [Acetobacter lovaniensis NRIC 0474]
MKKVDSNNGVWVNDDPTTLTNGTPIDADFMNNIQDEISNVITDNGNTLDGTNHSQLSQTLDKTFAKLNSPTLTGIPLTSNPDGTINNQIATVDYVNQKALQATVGFTPTQQGGGTDQGANKVYIGGDSTDATQVRVQVDQTDLGRLVFQDNDAYTHGVDQIGFNIGGQTFAFRDVSDKSWRFLYTTSQIDEKSYISSLPTGDNTKVTDIIWNTSSNLPAYYYGADNQVSYSATTDWSQEQFLQLSDEGIQSVSGPVAFGGQTTIPDVTKFDGKDALNAETAEGRYIKSVPGTSSGNTRIVDIQQSSDGHALFTVGSGTVTVGANLTDLPMDDPAIKMQVFYATPNYNLGSSNPVRINFPRAFKPGTQPVVMIPNTQELGTHRYWISNIIAGNDVDGATTELLIDNEGFSIGGYVIGASIQGMAGANMIIPVFAAGYYQ